MADKPKDVLTIDARKQTDQKLDIKSRWWLQPEDTLFNDIFGVVNSIEKNQSYRNVQNIKHARLYSNRDALGFYGTLFARTNSANIPNNRVTLNVIKSCVDTATAKIAKSKPKPQFLTHAGNFSEKKRAKSLTQYIQGVFYDTNLYSLGKKVFRDGGVLGTGVIKFYKDNAAGKIKAERVLSDEIIVDDAEGMYGAPRQIHQKKYIHREVLLDMFPEHSRKILEATGGVDGDNTSASSADLLKVLESWHLKSGTDTDDGLHTICIQNCTLFSEKYDKEYLPFVFFRWSDRLVGFYGQGIAEELVGIQIEINKMLRDIQEAQHLVARPKVLVNNASKLNSNHVTNEIGAIIGYTGDQPMFISPTAMPTEIYQHLERLYTKAYEITGISQMSATAQKPAGLNSGTALRTYSDIETERFVIIGQSYEDMFMEASKIIVDMSRDLYEDNKDLSVKAPGSKFISTIKWKDVNLEDEKFIMQVFPTGSLPSTPAGKLQMVQELIQAGFVDKQNALSMLDFPDLDGFISMETAALDDIEMVLEKIVDDKEYITPEPYMDLKRALSMAQSRYLRGKTQNLPEETLELLRTFMADCNELLNPTPELPSDIPAVQDQALNAAEQESLATEGQIAATPAALPVNDLIPNVPTE